MPKILEFNFKEYNRIRRLAILIAVLEVLRGIFIISIFILHWRVIIFKTLSSGTQELGWKPNVHKGQTKILTS